MYCLDGFHLNTAVATAAFGLCPVGVGAQCRAWYPAHVNAYIVSTATHIPLTPGNGFQTWIFTQLSLAWLLHSWTTSDAHLLLPYQAIHDPRDLAWLYQVNSKYSVHKSASTLTINQFKNHRRSVQCTHYKLYKRQSVYPMDSYTFRYHHIKRSAN
jgi:hypothetical protein